MPVRAHHTASRRRRQSPAPAPDSWATELVPRLPATLDAQARTLKAFQRARAFRCPSDLLRGLLVYALSPFGFRWLGAWGLLTDLADLSAAGWHDALIRASAWLLWLMGELLVANDRPVWITQRIRGRVWVVDASMLGQPGAHKCMDIQYAPISVEPASRSCARRPAAPWFRVWRYWAGSSLMPQARGSS